MNRLLNVIFYMLSVLLLLQNMTLLWYLSFLYEFIEQATYLADRVVVYEGQPGIECTAKSPESLLSGMNRFLKHLAITFRRDPNNYRPRINKKDSQKDKEQKASGNFFFMED